MIEGCTDHLLPCFVPMIDKPPLFLSYRSLNREGIAGTIYSISAPYQSIEHFLRAVVFHSSVPGQGGRVGFHPDELV